MTVSCGLRVRRVTVAPCQVHRGGCQVVLGQTLEEISHVDQNAANDTSTGWLDNILRAVYADVGARKVQQCRENLPAAMAGCSALLSSTPQSTFDNALPGLNPSPATSDSPEMREVNRAYFEEERDVEYYDDTKSNEERLLDLRQVPLLNRDQEYHDEVRKVEKLMEIEREAAFQRYSKNYTFKDHFIQLENIPFDERSTQYHVVRGQIQALLDKEEAQAANIINAIKLATSPSALRTTSQTRSYSFPMLNALSINKELPKLPNPSPKRRERKLLDLPISASQSTVLLDKSDNLSDSPHLHRLHSVGHSVKTLAVRSPLTSTSKLFKKVFQGIKKQSELGPITEADAKNTREKKCDEDGWGISSGNTSEAGDSGDDHEDTLEDLERIQRLKNYANAPMIVLTSA